MSIPCYFRCSTGAGVVIFTGKSARDNHRTHLSKDHQEDLEKVKNDYELAGNEFCRDGCARRRAMKHLTLHRLTEHTPQGIEDQRDWRRVYAEYVPAAVRSAQPSLYTSTRLEYRPSGPQPSQQPPHREEPESSEADPSTILESTRYSSPLGYAEGLADTHEHEGFYKQAPGGTAPEQAEEELKEIYGRYEKQPTTTASYPYTLVNLGFSKGQGGSGQDSQGQGL